MELKRCIKCEMPKTHNAFAFHCKGKGTRRSECKMCQRKITATHYQKNKGRHYANNKKRREANRALVNAVKSNPCVDCGDIFHYCQMHFDHRPGEEKLGNISDMIHAHYLKQALEEIKKCDLVCANCHSLRTWQRLQH